MFYVVFVKSESSKSDGNEKLCHILDLVRKVYQRVRVQFLFLK